MADQILFDKLVFIDRLKRAGISDEQARAHGDAMDEALRESVVTKIDLERHITATKADIAAVKTELKADIAVVRTELAVAVRDLTIRGGAMAAALFAALVSIKYFG